MIQTTTFDRLHMFSSDAPCEHYVLGHDCHTLGMKSTQIGVFENTNEIGLSSLLYRHQSRALEPNILLHRHGDLADKALERKLANKQLRGLLISANFTKSNSSRSVPMWFLDATYLRGEQDSNNKCVFQSPTAPVLNYYESANTRRSYNHY